MFDISFYLFIVIELIRFVKTGKKMIAESATRRIKEIQEMVNFVAKHDIATNIEVISIEYVNTAMERLTKGDVRYRFVIDLENTFVATKP